MMENNHNQRPSADIRDHLRRRETPVLSEDSDLSYQIIGGAMQVHNEIGPGLREKAYENALAIALREERLRVEQQFAYPIWFRGAVVGDCIPDLTIERTVLVDAKSIDGIGDQEIGQMLNYLRIAKLELGLVINFKNSKLEWKRVARTRDR